MQINWLTCKFSRFGNSVCAGKQLFYSFFEYAKSSKIYKIVQSFKAKIKKLLLLKYEQETLSYYVTYIFSFFFYCVYYFLVFLNIITIVFYLFIDLFISCTYTFFFNFCFNNTRFLLLFVCLIVSCLFIAFVCLIVSCVPCCFCLFDC